MSLKNNILIFTAAASAMSAGFWLATMQTSEVDKARELAIQLAGGVDSPIQGSILSPARKIAVPELTKDNGKLFSQSDISGHWSLVFFGYTNCPDICPVTLGVTAQAKKQAEAEAFSFPQVIFVSVDPKRDKVEMLADYVQYFDKDFIGVTGDSQMIKALTLQMSVAYIEAPAKAGDENYQVDHSAALLLINPEGKLKAFLNPPHDAATILKDIKTVEASYK